MSSTDASERPESVLPWGETDECPVCEAAGAVCRYAYGLVVPPEDMSLEDYGLMLERQRVVLAGCDVRRGLAYVCRTCGSTRPPRCDVRDDERFRCSGCWHMDLLVREECAPPWSSVVRCPAHQRCGCTLHGSVGR